MRATIGGHGSGDGGIGHRDSLGSILQFLGLTTCACLRFSLFDFDREATPAAVLS